MGRYGDLALGVAVLLAVLAMVTGLLIWLAEGLLKSFRDD